MTGRTQGAIRKQRYGIGLGANPVSGRQLVAEISQGAAISVVSNSANSLARSGGPVPPSRPARRLRGRVTATNPLLCRSSAVSDTTMQPAIDCHVIGSSPSLLAALRKVAIVAPTDVTVRI